MWIPECDMCHTRDEASIRGESTPNGWRRLRVVTGSPYGVPDITLLLCRQCAGDKLGEPKQIATQEQVIEILRQFIAEVAQDVVEDSERG